jgi:hypothetical protein
MLATALSAPHSHESLSVRPPHRRVPMPKPLVAGEAAGADAGAAEVDSIVGHFRTARHDLLVLFPKVAGAGTDRQLGGGGGGAGGLAAPRASTAARTLYPPTSSTLPLTPVASVAGVGGGASSGGGYHVALASMLRHELRFQVHVRKQVARSWRAMQRKVSARDCLRSFGWRRHPSSLCVTSVFGC